ncbi:EF-hand domain-containing protein [Psidium guajava]|nr:EF-hand domain-containing protein [Psidium guajava]
MAVAMTDLLLLVNLARPPLRPCPTPMATSSSSISGIHLSLRMGHRHHRHSDLGIVHGSHGGPTQMRFGASIWLIGIGAGTLTRRSYNRFSVLRRVRGSALELFGCSCSYSRIPMTLFDLPPKSPLPCGVASSSGG